MFKSEYLNDAEVADVLGISVKALRNKLSAGQELPPRIKPPGFNIRLWLKNDVHAWLEKYTDTGCVNNKSIRRVSRK